MTVTKEQFGLWKHEPVTKFFFKFLRDKTEFMTRRATEQWLDGKAWPETVRGQIIELIEVLATEYEFIEEFYKESDVTKPEGNT